MLITVLGEIPDQDAALREIARVLKPGGRLVVGELFGDPHMVTSRALRKRTSAAGLRFDRRVGNPLGILRALPDVSARLARLRPRDAARASHARWHPAPLERAAIAYTSAGEFGAVWIAAALAAAALDRGSARRVAHGGGARAGLARSELPRQAAPRAASARELRGLEPLGRRPATLSFPSGHAATSFAAATAAARSRPPPRRPLLVAAARDGTDPPVPRAPLPLRRRSPAPSLGAAVGSRRSGPLPMKVGIVGLPNAGKSTLFNALTRAGAQAAEYPFTTVDPNVAIVPVPDERLDAIGEALGIDRRLPEQIEFVDIAGLVRGAHKGEGLGNRFLGPHPRRRRGAPRRARLRESPGRTSPWRQRSACRSRGVETELLLADLESAQRRLEARGEGGAQQRQGGDARGRALARDRGGSPATGDARAAEAELLTSKPALVVANVGEGEALPGAWPRVAASRSARATRRSSRSSSRRRRPRCVASSASTRRAGRRRPRGLRAARPDHVLHAVGGTEVRARSLRRGATAPEAAGRVHTDMQRGFVRAEVISWQDLVEAGSFARAREQRPASHRGPRLRRRRRRRADDQVHRLTAATGRRAARGPGAQPASTR